MAIRAISRSRPPDRSARNLRAAKTSAHSCVDYVVVDWLYNLAGRRVPVQWSGVGWNDDPIAARWLANKTPENFRSWIDQCNKVCALARFAASEGKEV
jgi:hypothetical protein